MIRWDVEPHSNDVRKRKMTLKLHSRTPSLLQDSTSLPATAESGLKRLDGAYPPVFPAGVEFFMIPEGWSLFARGS